MPMPIAGRVGLITAMMIDSLGTGLFLPFTILYFIRATKLSTASIGLSLTIAALLVLPVPMAVGVAVDRLGSRLVVILGNFVSAVGFASYIIVGNQLELVGAAVLAGAGQAMFWTAIRSLIAEITTAGERRTWFAFQVSIRNAGYALGALAATFAVGLSVPGVFRSLPALDAASFALAGVLVFRWQPPSLEFVKDQNNTTDLQPLTPPVPPTPPATYRSALADSALLTLSAINLAFVLCVLSVSLIMSVYVVKTLHQAPWVVGQLFALNTILVVVVQTPLTLRTRTVPAGKIVRAAAAVWAVSFALLWTASIIPGKYRIAILIVDIIIFTIGEMLFSPTLNALAIEISPERGSSRHMSVFQLSWNVGSAVAPAILTQLLTAGPEWLWSTLVILCILMGATISMVVPQASPPASNHRKPFRLRAASRTGNHDSAQSAH